MHLCIWIRLFGNTWSLALALEASTLFGTHSSQYPPTIYGCDRGSLFWGVFSCFIGGSFFWSPWSNGLGAVAPPPECFTQGASFLHLLRDYEVPYGKSGLICDYEREMEDFVENKLSVV